MAQRKNIQTEPILDNSALTENPDLELVRRVHALGSHQFNGICRKIKLAPLTSIEVVRNAVRDKRIEMGFEPAPELAIKKVPRTGSDQFDAGTFVTWVAGITRDDDDSIRQLLILDACLTVRFAE
jgi:hypothetical protein